MKVKVNTEVNCPVCRSNAEFGYNVDAGEVQQGLSQIFGSKVPADILEQNYKMYKCSSCTLEFAWPLIPGSKKFYDFLTQQNGYYSDYRPEYKIVWDFLRTRTGETRILDVGCGDGSFLKGTLDIPGVKAIGIDTTLESVNKAKSKGIEAYQVAIEDLNTDQFDVIVSFHCLEHVSDPLGFMNGMTERLRTNGEIIISTPYSPMIFEYFWFHPLNHPPHHTLRLNKKAYCKIANCCGLNVSFVNVDSLSFMSMVATCFSFAVFGKNSRDKLGIEILKHPLLFVRSFFKIMFRERIGNKIAGDTLLVKFRKN